LTRKKRLLPPVHPGEILLHEFLQPMELSQYALAQSTGVPPRRINEIVLGKRSISADFGMEPQFWLNLQSRYDLDVAKDALGARLEREVRPRAA
jgi:addiction module HigA family antidote